MHQRGKQEVGPILKCEKIKHFDSPAKKKREGLSALDKPLDGDRFETREMGPTQIFYRGPTKISNF